MIQAWNRWSLPSVWKSNPLTIWIHSCSRTQAWHPMRGLCILMSTRSVRASQAATTQRSSAAPPMTNSQPSSTPPSQLLTKSPWLSCKSCRHRERSGFSRHTLQMKFKVCKINPSGARMIILHAYLQEIRENHLARASEGLQRKSYQTCLKSNLRFT